MGRVSTETIEKLNEFIDSLGDEAKSKCAICNETLTHIVKQAEAQVRAGTATVTRILAEKINENAAPSDRVSGVALRKKVQRHEGLDIKCPNRTNNHFADIPQDQIDSISGGHTDANGNPIRDPKLREKETAANRIFFPHILTPIEQIASCPVSPQEVYDLIPSYCLKRLEHINEAIGFLNEVKAIHEVNNERN